MAIFKYELWLFYWVSWNGQNMWSTFCFEIVGHFHNLLCEEMIFPQHKEKNYVLRYEVIIFSRVVKMLFPLFYWLKYSFIPAVICIYFMQRYDNWLFLTLFPFPPIKEGRRKGVWSSKTGFKTIFFKGSNRFSPISLQINGCTIFSIFDDFPLFLS